MPRKAIIIGAGVSGLTTAFELKKAGWDIVVLYDRPAKQTVSTVAGALWEWPPAVCGFHTDQASLERSKQWSRESYDELEKLANDPLTGVRMINSYFYFRHLIRESEFDRTKMNEIQGVVRGFEHDTRWLKRNRITAGNGLQDCYRFISPVIHTETYLGWMKEKLLQDSVSLIHRRIEGGLEDQLALLKEFNASCLINCSGLGARRLSTDATVYPLRGALIRLKIAEGNISDDEKEVIGAAHCISHDNSRKQQNMIYIIPRGGHLLLGGVAQPDEWETGINLENSHDVRDIMGRCFKLMPWLSKLPVDFERPVAVGLRPARKANVRLEVDPAIPVIHNYGHGGSGFSFSWGCAREVKSLIESFTAE